MNRILTIGLFSTIACISAAQAQTTSIRIGSNVTWAQFSVDGQTYSAMQTFVWPKGSTHIVQFQNQMNQNTTYCASNLDTALQLANDATKLLTFSGWVDNTGTMITNGSPVVTVVADPNVTSLIANVVVKYRIIVQLFENNGATSPVQGVTGPVCSPPSPGVPPADNRPGLVTIASAAYWQSVVLYLQAGPVALTAYPYPGYAFTGWLINGGTLGSVATYDVENPATLAPQFVPAKRVRYITNPMGLNVLIDRTSVPTIPYLATPTSPVTTCPPDFVRQPAAPPGVPALCFGDFDFAPGSQHLMSAPTPQYDSSGKLWAFNAWASGGGENTVYTTDPYVWNMDVQTASFMPAAVVDVYSNPPGLPVLIDGRSNWPQPSFAWGIGTTHTITAPATVSNNKGRKYSFQSWSNNGPATQTVAVDSSFMPNGLVLTAAYNLESRLVVQTSPSGLTVQVDGNSCVSPCTVDKPSGSTVHVVAPSSIAQSNNSRLDFSSWTDGATADHVVTLSGDTTTVTAMYQTMYLLSLSSNPSGGATFQLNPSSHDLYYPAGATVQVTAQTNPGFKFRRWGGDLSGTYPTGLESLSAPGTVIAMLDTVPYIAPAGIQNAAGATPDNVVAPGSMITVFGASLTTTMIVGPINPLSQTLGGLVVTVGDRILPLLFVSPTQVNAQLPYDIAESDYTLTVSATGQPDVTGKFTVARNAPGLFINWADSKAYALAFHQDGSVITATSPAIQGETVTIYGTGFGPCKTPGIAGFLVKNAAPDPLLDAVQIQLGDFTPAATWSGAAPDYIGMEITKFQITPDLPSGTTLNLKIVVNGRSSNTVLLPLQ